MLETRPRCPRSGSLAHRSFLGRIPASPGGVHGCRRAYTATDGNLDRSAGDGPRACTARAPSCCHLVRPLSSSFFFFLADSFLSESALPSAQRIGHDTKLGPSLRHVYCDEEISAATLGKSNKCHIVQLEWSFASPFVAAVYWAVSDIWYYALWD